MKPAELAAVRRSVASAKAKLPPEPEVSEAEYVRHYGPELPEVTERWGKVKAKNEAEIAELKAKLAKEQKGLDKNVKKMGTMVPPPIVAEITRKIGTRMAKLQDKIDELERANKDIDQRPGQPAKEEAKAPEPKAPEAKMTVEEGPDGYRLAGLSVAEAERGKGAGTRAVRSLIVQSDATGKPIYTTAHAESPAMQARLNKFYEGLGFEHWKDDPLSGKPMYRYVPKTKAPKAPEPKPEAPKAPAPKPEPKKVPAPKPEDVRKELNRRGVYDAPDGTTWKIQTAQDDSFYIETTRDGQRTEGQESFRSIQEAQDAAIQQITGKAAPKEAPAPKPASKGDVEAMLKADVPDTTEAKARVKVIETRKAELRDQGKALDDQIKALEANILPKRRSRFAPNTPKASAKKADIAQWRELQKKRQELSNQYQALDEATRGDQAIIDQAANAKIINDPAQLLIHRLDRKLRSMEGDGPPELVAALRAEEARMIKEKYPDATPEEIKQLGGQLGVSSHHYPSDPWKDPHLPNLYDQRRKALEAEFNGRMNIEDLPPELLKKIDQYSNVVKNAGEPRTENHPIQNLTRKALADLQGEIKAAFEKLHEASEAEKVRLKAEADAETAKEEKLIEEAQAVADSAKRVGTTGGRTAKEVKADLVARVWGAIKEMVEKDKVTLQRNDEGTYAAQSDRGGVSFGEIEPGSNGKFRVTARTAGGKGKDGVSAVVDTAEEAQLLIKAMASSGPGRAIIGVPGDGTYKLLRYGPTLLKVWDDARKLDVGQGGQNYTTRGGSEKPPMGPIKTEGDWDEAKAFHNLEATDKIAGYSPALRDFAEKVAKKLEVKPGELTVKQVEDWIDAENKATGETEENACINFCAKTGLSYRGGWWVK